MKEDKDMEEIREKILNEILLGIATGRAELTMLSVKRR